MAEIQPQGVVGAERQHPRHRKRQQGTHRRVCERVGTEETLVGGTEHLGIAEDLYAQLLFEHPGHPVIEQILCAHGLQLRPGQAVERQQRLELGQPQPCIRAFSAKQRDARAQGFDERAALLPCKSNF